MYTNWPQAGDSVLGLANAKYKDFGVYSEAAEAKVAAGFASFTVFDGKTHTLGTIMSETDQNK